MTRPAALRVPDEIPTSSMADIAFLLIVFFLVTATFAATRGLDFLLPNEENAGPIEPEDAILVEVEPGGSLRVDRRPVRLADLLSALQPKLERNPVKPVIVKAAPESAYGAMVDVLDELRQGRQRLGLAEDIRVSLPTAREAAALWGIRTGSGT